MLRLGRYFIIHRFSDDDGPRRTKIWSNAGAESTLNDCENVNEEKTSNDNDGSALSKLAASPDAWLNDFKREMNSKI